MNLPFSILQGNWIHEAHGPLRQRLAEELQRGIEGGDLMPGSQLPPERGLALQLGVSRTTIVGAYDLLQEAGWLERRQGSGTYVAGSSSERSDATAQLARSPSFRALLDGADGMIDFSCASPGADEAVTRALQEAAGRDLARHSSGHGLFGGGLPELRRSIAAHLTATGLATKEDEVLVTTGSQQAIAVTAALHVAPGDTVIIETPTYPGAVDAFRAVGARLLPLPIRSSGAHPADLANLLSRSTARLVYLTPTFNNPTGALIPEAARRELARVMERHQVTLLEDMAMADLPAGAGSPPPIAAFAGGPTTVAVGSLSKLYWAGLRVGWARASRHQIGRLVRLKSVADVSSSALEQLAAVRLLAEFGEVQARRHEQLAARLRLTEELLRQQLPDWSWTAPMGGLTLWIRLPQGDAEEFAAVALRHGVIVVSGPHFTPNEGCRDRLRLTFVLPPQQLELGIRRLARAWRSYLEGPGTTSGPTDERAIV